MNETTSSTPLGVLLLYMGGPRTIDDVKPFLRALFADRELIRLPGGPLLQPLLARFIVNRRAPRVTEYYREIGGGSPLLETTEAQAERLHEALSTHGKVEVALAMRYCEPRVDEALTQLAEQGVQRLVALTLYPHYSCATSGSSFNDLRRAAAASEKTFQIIEIESFFDHPRYLDALADTVHRALARLENEATVVFSAHSLPQKLVDAGDPYRDQVEATVAGVVQRLGLSDWHLGFQSRSGPVRWLSPNTVQLCDELIDAGKRRLVLVPVSFVSDHIETLHELDIQLKDHCIERGATHFVRAEALGEHPDFIAALVDLVLRGEKDHG